MQLFFKQNLRTMKEISFKFSVSTTMLHYANYITKQLLNISNIKKIINRTKFIYIRQNFNN